jgi:simple sugar transport system permease protein
MVWEIFTTEFMVKTVALSLSISTVIFVAAIGEIIAEKAGVLNVGLEGYMLMGALAGLMTVQATGNLVLAIFVGIAAGTVMSMVHAYLSITLKVSQIVSGIAIWIFSLGFTGYIFRAFGSPKMLSVQFTPINVPGLSDLPYVGPIIFSQSPLVYIGLVIVVSSWIILSKTTFGMKIRAVGEDAWTADVMGVNVYKIRYAATAICGIFGGFAGTYLTISLLGFFIEGLTGGRGFIALAIAIASGWHPLVALGIAWAVGFADSLQLRLIASGIPIPYPFMMMVPYILTVLILICIRKVKVPRQLCIPYEKPK